MQVGFKGFHISKEKQDIKIPFLHCGQEYQLVHGSVVIAAVISCTNNCNPSVMLTAGKALSEKIKLFFFFTFKLQIVNFKYFQVLM